MNDSVVHFIDRLPKTETHLHIEGALPWPLLEQTNPVKFSGTPSFRKPNFRYDSFEQFESILIDHALDFFCSPESYFDAARAIFENHLEQNVKYVEISFHAGMIEYLKIPGEEILKAIVAAIPTGLEVRVFLGISRNLYTENLAPQLEQAICSWSDLAGIDLHGLETLPMESWTAPFWKRAKDCGKVVKAHAGEFGPAENVFYAIKELGVQRIQHGTKSIESREVMNVVKDHEVTFDMCPISNFKLRVIENWEDYPLPHFLQEKIPCTLSTDDPLSFNNSLNEEYHVCFDKLGLGLPELAQLARNGFINADLSRDLKDFWVHEIQNVLNEFSQDSW
jgi:adenosine deaminase